jgi:hypothetical protein
MWFIKKKEVNMRCWKQISLLSFCVLILMASTSGKPAWQMKADYVEACSCHLFCPCYPRKEGGPVAYYKVRIEVWCDRDP